MFCFYKKKKICYTLYNKNKNTTRSDYIMKKFAVLAGISASVLCGVIAISGCSASSTTFSANWYKNTSITTAISGTSEKLTYEISYTAGTNEEYGLNYSDGTYETNLINTTYSYEDGSTPENVYLLTTSLKTNVSYAIGDESATYTDTVTSKVYFKTVDNALQPIYSYKEFSCHSPLGATPVSFNDSVIYYHYSFETVYDKTLSTATLTYKKLDGDESALKDSEKEYSVSTNYTYLDNEELLFAVRGMTISEDSSTTISTLNASRSLTQNVSITNNGSEAGTYKFDMGEGETDYSITANKITIIISSLQSGGEQTAYYAAASTDNNEYRGVMLSLDTTLPYALGTLSYNLTKAEFSSK